MLVKRLLILLFSGILTLSGIGESEVTYTSGKPITTLVESSSQEIILKVRFPEYEFMDNSNGDAQTPEIVVPGIDTFTQERGRPRIPVHSILIGIPPVGQPAVEVLDDDFTALNLWTKWQINTSDQPINQDLVGGTRTTVLSFPGEGTYPESPARIADEAWLRNQRILRIEFSPLQLDGNKQKVNWRSEITVRVRFDPEQEYKNQIQEEINLPTQFEQILASTLFNYESAKIWRARQTDASSNNPLQSVTDPQYKIKIVKDGLYRITFDTLIVLGIPVDEIDLSTIRLTCQGEEIAIFVDSQAREIIFYAEKFRGDRLAAHYAEEDDQWLAYDSQSSDGSYLSWQPRFTAKMLEKYTDENIYWLTYGQMPGLRVNFIDGTPNGGVEPQSFRETLHFEQSNQWNTTHFTSEDTWFWEEIDTKELTQVSRNYPLDIYRPVNSGVSAIIRGDLVAKTYNNFVSPDHEIQISIDNNPINLIQATWDGKSRFRFTGTFPSSLLKHGTIQLNLLVKKTPALQSSEKILVDWFEVEYDREYRAVQNTLQFPSALPGKNLYQVSGFSSNHPLTWDITDPLQPEMITGTGYSNGVLSITLEEAQKRRYFSGSAIEIMQNEIQAVPEYGWDTEAEYVIITSDELRVATQPLADFQIGRGLTANVFSFEAIVDEFNYGIYHPIAIKKFLEYTFLHWSEPPVYAVLVGDGHWNFQESTTYGTGTIQLPPNLGWVDPWQGEVDSVNLLANVVGTDILPDVIMSRIPVNNSVELDVFIQKITGYEGTQGQDWIRNQIFIADNTPDPAGDFIRLSDGIIRDFTFGYNPIRKYLNDICGQPGYDPSKCPSPNEQIIDAVNDQGSLIINYIGHGSVTSWAGEVILNVDDIIHLVNSDRLPILFSMTCLDGYWSHPNLEMTSLVESLLRKSGGGIIGAFSPTGLGVASGHDILHRGVYRALFQENITEIGAATMLAKLDLYASGRDYDLIQTFIYFGDPSMIVPVSDNLGYHLGLPTIYRR